MHMAQGAWRTLAPGRTRRLTRGGIVENDHLRCSRAREENLSSLQPLSVARFAGAPRRMARPVTYARAGGRPLVPSLRCPDCLQAGLPASGQTERQRAKRQYLVSYTATGLLGPMECGYFLLGPPSTRPAAAANARPPRNRRLACFHLHTHARPLDLRHTRLHSYALAL